MARKFRTPIGISWNCNRCEEIVLIDAYLTARSRARPEEKSGWVAATHANVFDVAHPGWSQRSIDRINSVLKRIGKKTVVLSESDLLHSKFRDHSEVRNFRAELLTELEALSSKERQKLVAQAHMEIEQLPPPRLTLEQWEAEQEEREHENREARANAEARERARQAAVVRLIPKEQIDPESEAVPEVVEEPADKPIATTPNAEPTLDLETAKLLLAETDDQTLKNRLVAHILKLTLGS